MSRDERDKLQQEIGGHTHQKHQAVFHLDFETWEDIIQTFDIKESIIPHRTPDPATTLGATGWYG